MKQKLSTSIVFLLFCLSVLLLLGLINLFGPSDLGVGGIFLVLMAAYLVFFLLFLLLFRIALIISYRSIGDVKKTLNTNRHRRKALLISAVLAFAPLLLVSMNSLGQMQLWYIALVVLFEFVAIFFIIKKV